MLPLIVALTEAFSGICKRPTTKNCQLVHSSTALRSYGDPNGSQKSSFYRNLQSFLRNFDHFIYPNDPDIAGLTFPSRVEWAPWMESIWFGNFYDYRAAYFHDVMYSNNIPAREGALLFKETDKAIQLALLYQRYKKFDTSSYSTPNAVSDEMTCTFSLFIH